MMNPDIVMVSKRACESMFALIPYSQKEGKMVKKNSDMDALLDNYFDVNGCHEYQGSINNRGYGKFRWEGKQVLAHRASYERKNGSIPEGKLICHTCDNRKCINPNHLYAGTYGDNARDRYHGISKRRCENKVYRDVACLNIRVCPKLHEKVMDKCAETRVSIKDYLVNLIEKDLKQ